MRAWRASGRAVAAPPAAAGAAGLAEAAPAALLLAIFVAWAADDGGFAPTAWMPGALFALGLVVVLALWDPPRRPLRLSVVGASLFLVAFTAWSYGSIAWAGVKGDAWDGADRTLLYLCVFLVFSWLRPLPGLGLALLACYGVAVAAVGAVELSRAARAAAPEDFFVVGRLATPITYPNANVALFLAAAVPPLVLATRRSVHALARGVALASVGVLAELALLCQSRASLVAVPLTLAVLVALAPRRLLLVLALAVVAVPVGLFAHRLLAVYPAVTAGRLATARVGAARDAVAATGGALLVAGAVLAAVDRRVRLPAALVRRLGVAVGIAAAAAVVAAGAAVVARYGNPVHEAAAAWRRFKVENRTSVSPGGHLLAGIGSPRYDIWRVALLEFRGSPLHGVGVDNYAVDYLRLRRTLDEPLYPHSVELRLLSQTGIVGTALFAGFLACVAAAIARALRRGASERGRALSAACVGAFAYWFVHGSVDWFWEFPALAAPAFACLGLAARAARGSRRPRRPWAAPAVRYALLLPAAAAAAALALPWVAAREVNAAAAGWRADPQRAFRQLALARRLDPLGDAADLTTALIALRLGDRARAERAFRAALGRDRYSWYAHLELAALASEAGHGRAALVHLRAARALDPLDPLIGKAFRATRAGERFTTGEIDEALRSRTAILTGRRQR